MGNKLENIFNLKGRCYVITGATGLLGRKHAEAIACYGGIPILIDLSKKLVDNFVDELNLKYKIKSIGFVVDITDEQAIKHNADLLMKKFGKIDGLVNNAANNPKVEKFSDVNFSRLESFPLNTWNEDMGLEDDTTMEWVDRYTVKIKNPKYTSIYKASNFSTLPVFLKKRAGYKTVIFEGPGKAESTQIFIKDFSNDPNDKGKYAVPDLTFMSLISDIFNDFKPESREPINIDFFMSLENFNDRIWSDN